jgi:phosphoribosylanthranilate isomerase
MSLFVKICGICSRSDLEQICALGPNAIGFVFWPKSKRYVRPEQVSGWLSCIPETVKKVGVFVEPSADEVEEIARVCQLDVIQIHLTSNEWKIDRPLYDGLEVWLAPRLSEAGLSQAVDGIVPEPSVLLADSFDPETIGGTGQTADADDVVSLKSVGKPIILAGGLTPENVCEAIAKNDPWGIDVSSGVEKEPGVKDLRKVKRFIESVRS